MPSSHAHAHPLLALTSLDVTRLDSCTPPFTIDRSLSPTALPLHRYRDVVPYDASLLPGPYLNASSVPPFLPHLPRFVASQAPLPETFGAFYHHVYTQRTRVLVNLTPEIERARRKADRYYPSLELGEGEVVHQGWKVRCLEEVRVGEVVRRTLGITPPPASASASATTAAQSEGEAEGKGEAQGEQRKVVQLHLTHWPDHGVMPPDQLQHFVHLVLTTIQSTTTDAPTPAASSEEGDGPPVWIHCSAGIGRTGTVIACLVAHHLLRDRASAAAAEVDTADPTALALRLVEWTRRYRPGMVQTPQQFDAIVEFIAAIEPQS
ncbi:hypothetical protein ACQY0O_003395 [Thecaphora frezii]